MTGNRCLLDTSVIIHTFRKNSLVTETLDSFTEILIPIEVIGELFVGAYRSGQPEKHIQQINLFIQNCVILPPDKDTAIYYGKIKSKLMAKGTPIPENDIWIAALAAQHNLPVFTSDAHFSEIEEIKTI